jgi:hypothetical protein
MERLTSLLLGPISIVVGLALMIYGIFAKPKQKPLRRSK